MKKNGRKKKDRLHLIFTKDVKQLAHDLLEGREELSVLVQPSYYTETQNIRFHTAIGSVSHACD